MLWVKPPHEIYKVIKEYEDEQNVFNELQKFENMKQKNKNNQKFLEYQNFDDVIIDKKPMADINGHWRVFARHDHTERVHLIELSDFSSGASNNDQ